MLKHKPGPFFKHVDMHHSGGISFLIRTGIASLEYLSGFIGNIAPKD
jgi:hypothetical protein